MRYWVLFVSKLFYIKGKFVRVGIKLTFDLLKMGSVNSSPNVMNWNSIGQLISLFHFFSLEHATFFLCTSHNLYFLLIRLHAFFFTYFSYSFPRVHYFNLFKALRFWYFINIVKEYRVPVSSIDRSILKKWNNDFTRQINSNSEILPIFNQVKYYLISNLEKIFPLMKRFTFFTNSTQHIF